jgi:hypothetical protein
MNGPRGPRLVPALALCLLLAAGATPAADGGSDSVEELRHRFAGDYRFVGGATERALVPAAVQRSVDGMFFISRGIAYDRLLRNCEICSTYGLSFSGGQVTIRGPCQLPDIGPDDGREVEHRTKHGDLSKLSQRFVDGALVQDFRGEQGSRRVVWTLQPDGETLRVQMVITSGHLPHAVDYTLTYRRLPPAPPQSSDGGTGPSGSP